MIYIFFPTIKSITGKKFEKGCDFLDLGGFESFSYSFLKPTNASSVLRGKGVVDGRSSPFEDRAFTVGFTITNHLFDELLYFYNLSNIFGLIPIKNLEIFNHIFKPYADYLKDEAYVSLFNMDDKTKNASSSFVKKISSGLTCSNGNFFAMLRKLSVKTIPGKTVAFSVEMEFVPYFFSLNLVMRNPKFWDNYFSAFKKKAGILTSLYDYIKEKPVSGASDLTITPIAKNYLFRDKTVAGSSINKENALITPTVVPSKVLSNIEVVIYNNIAQLPLQGYTPAYQHLGRGEIGITIGMDFARDLSSGSDSFVAISNKMNLIAKFNQQTHYLNVSHWLFECFDLTNFYLQGVTILDKESDTSQQSAISSFFLANSYSQDDLLYNAYRANVNDLDESATFSDKLSMVEFFVKVFNSNSDDSSTINSLPEPQLLRDLNAKRLEKIISDLPKFLTGKGSYYSPYVSVATVLLSPIISKVEELNIIKSSLDSNGQARAIDSSSTLDYLGSIVYSEVFEPPTFADGVEFSSPTDTLFKKFCSYIFYRAFFGAFLIKSVDYPNDFFACFAAGVTSVNNVNREKLVLSHTPTSPQASKNADSYSTVANKFFETEMFRLKRKFSSGLPSSGYSVSFKTLYNCLQIRPVSQILFYDDFYQDVFSPADNFTINRFGSLIESASSEFYGPACSLLANPQVFNVLKRVDSPTNPFLKNKSNYYANELAGTTDFSFPNLDYDVFFEGESFWGSNGHPSDIIKDALATIDGKTNTDITLSSIATEIYKAYSSKNISDSDLNGIMKSNSNPEGIDSDIVNNASLGSNGYNVTDFNKTATADALQKRINKHAQLLSGQLYDFMPVVYLEFCYMDSKTDSATLSSYHTLNSYGYANKIVDYAVTSDPDTRIKTCQITLLDVQGIQKTVVNGKTVSIKAGASDDGTTTIIDPRFEYSRKDFPIGIGSRVVLSIGQSKNDLKSVFTGTVESISTDTEKNYLILECASFAKTLHTGDYKLSFGPGGDNVVENLFSANNLAVTWNYIVDKFKYPKEYYENLCDLHNASSSHKSINKEFIPAYRYGLNAFMDTEFQITSYFLLSTILSQASRTYLQSLNNVNSDGSLAFIKASDRRKYGGFALKKKNVATGSILKNINNVDFDFKYYGVRNIDVSTLTKWSTELVDLVGRDATALNGKYYNTSSYCDILFPAKGSVSEDDASKVYNDSDFGSLNVDTPTVTLANGNAVSSFTNSSLKKKFSKKPENFFGDGIALTYRKDSTTVAGLLDDMEARYPGATWDVLEDGRGATLFFGRTNYYVQRSSNPYVFNSEVAYAIVNSKLDSKVNSDSLTSVLKNYKVSYNTIVDDLISKKGSSLIEHYRNQYVAISGLNLISCNLTPNFNIANTAVVDYDYSLVAEIFTDLISNFSKLFNNMDDLGTVTVPSLANIPEELVVPIKNTQESIRNLNGETQAYEYGLSMLEKEYSNFYSGKIVLTYSPEVRSGTELFLADAYNKIFGSVICKAVSHYANASDGFITVVTPQMKVDFSSPNESLTNSLKGIGVASEISGSNSKFDAWDLKDVLGLSVGAVTTNPPIVTSPGLVTSNLSKKEGSYKFNYNIKFPNSQSLGLGVTLHPITVGGEVLSPYTEELKAYSIGYAHSATVLEKFLGKNKSNINLDNNVFWYQSWFNSIGKWFGDVTTSFSNIFSEQAEGFSLLDSILNEDPSGLGAPSYDPTVVLKDEKRRTFFISVSKGLFDFLNESSGMHQEVVDALTEIHELKKKYKVGSNDWRDKYGKFISKGRRHSGFNLVAIGNKANSKYALMISEIVKAPGRSFGFGGATNFKTALSGHKFTKGSFYKLGYTNLYELFTDMHDCGIVLEFIVNYYAAFKFANYLKSSNYSDNIVFADGNLDAVFKNQNEYNIPKYTSQTYSARNDAWFRNAVIGAKKAGINPLLTPVFVHFSHDFHDPNLMGFVPPGDSQKYLTPLPHLENYLIPSERCRSFELKDFSDFEKYRDTIKSSSNMLISSSLNSNKNRGSYDLDSDAQYFELVYNNIFGSNIIIFKGKGANDNTALIDLYDMYKVVDNKNELFYKFANIFATSSSADRTYSTESSKKFMTYKKIQVDYHGAKRFGAYYLPGNENDSVITDHTLYGLSFSILAQKDTPFHKAMQNFAPGTSLFEALFSDDAQETAHKIREVFGGSVTLTSELFDDFVAYSTKIAVALDKSGFPTVSGSLPKINKSTANSLDALYWNNEDCDFPVDYIYDSKGSVKITTTQSLVFFKFLWKIMNMARVSILSEVSAFAEIYLKYHAGIAPPDVYNYQSSYFGKNVGTRFPDLIADVCSVHFNVCSLFYGVNESILPTDVHLRQIKAFTYSKSISKREFCLCIVNTKSGNQFVNMQACDVSKSTGDYYKKYVITDSKKGTIDASNKYYAPFATLNKKIDVELVPVNYFFTHSPEDIENNINESVVRIEDYLQSIFSDQKSYNISLADMNFHTVPVSGSDISIPDPVYAKKGQLVSSVNFSKFCPTTAGRKVLDMIYYSSAYTSYQKNAVFFNNHLKLKSKLVKTTSGLALSNHPIIGFALGDLPTPEYGSTGLAKDKFNNPISIPILKKYTFK